MQNCDLGAESKVYESTKLIKTSSHVYDYFIEGFDLTREEQEIRDRLLSHMPTLKTKTYRDSLFKIVTSFSELDHFSDNLEGKVDKLLLAQESTFVQSYKQHIDKIQAQFSKLHSVIGELQDKIRYYQNEGKMSALVKKVFQLEQESSKLFHAMAEKDKKIRDLELTVAMQRKEMKILQETIKASVREKSLLLAREIEMKEGEGEETPVRLEDISVFPTEPIKKSSYGYRPEVLEQTSAKNLANTSLKSITVSLSHHEQQQLHSKSLQKSSREEILSKQNNRLKLRNKKLLSHHVKIINTQGELSSFFVNCVEQLKKQIRIRKKVDFCTFDDFKKEDKLMLMIKVLSNDEILSHLYDKIFPKYRLSVAHCDLNKEPLTQAKTIEKLPKLNFNLSYQQK